MVPTTRDRLEQIENLSEKISKVIEDREIDLGKFLSKHRYTQQELSGVLVSTDTYLIFSDYKMLMITRLLTFYKIDIEDLDIENKDIELVKNIKNKEEVEDIIFNSICEKDIKIDQFENRITKLVPDCKPFTLERLFELNYLSVILRILSITLPRKVYK